MKKELLYHVRDPSRLVYKKQGLSLCSFSIAWGEIMQTHAVKLYTKL